MTHLCKIEWTGYDWDDQIKVTSPTGRFLRIYIVRAPNGWSFFSDVEQTLFHKLMQGSWCEEKEVLLTTEEMATFKAAHDRADCRSAL